jgi:type III secretory pathway component EscV
MIRNLLFLIMLILFTQCGFKIIDTSASTLKIERIEIEGYNKVNFLIKNDLLNKNRSSGGTVPIILQIETNRKKEIFEKNIRNEITKYKIILDTKVKIKRSTQEKLSEFMISSNGDYRIETSSIQTAKNIINLEKKLSSEISKKIQQKLFYLNNDL